METLDKSNKEEAAEEVEYQNQSSLQVFIKEEAEDEQDSKYHIEEQDTRWAILYFGFDEN
jgi:hypothetical protein